MIFLLLLSLFSDAPYYVRGVSISQDVCVCVCLCVCPRHFVQNFEKSEGIELQMSEQVAATLPIEPFRTLDLSDYFTK